ncbi:glutamate receptor [Striga asiatica]|uniref:Glutamate receptor n=1 Tax=Striga asiatica TaxID=4170 RepID=A0A5A7R310_STRAF|nr:glutamate receptor [Striga asiatica]
MALCSHFLALFALIFFSVKISCSSASGNGTSGQEPPSLVVPVGVVLDLSSSLGSMAASCMKMAVSDFYSTRSDYRTRLKLHIKSVDSVVDANFAAVELLKKEQVDGIIGPQESTQETFFAELAQKTRVPTISFTSTISTLPYNNYFFRTTPDDAVQAQALAAIIRGFEWPEIAVLYEDTQSTDRFLSHLNRALQESEIRQAYSVPIATSADSSRILRELNRFGTRQTRVFLVHMGPSLGHRFFDLAKRAGLMSPGYAWLVTYSLSVFLGSAGPAARDSMEGVLGVRPHVPRSEALQNFRERWRLRDATAEELNVYGLWAYDAVTALATAAERAVSVNSSLSNSSGFGSRILEQLSSVEFRGLSGEFRLVDGKLSPSPVEIFNVIGSGEKTVGYWTQSGGLVRELVSPSGGKTSGYSTSAKGLKNIMWPGDSVTRPKGWAIPKLRVGVPCKLGFTEFVNVAVDRKTNRTNATGFSVDIFLATLDLLPFPVDYEFSYYNDTEHVNWSYDDMLHKIPQEFDMVVGDTTIWAPRAIGVDFSLPYSESGVILVVKNRKPFDMWIFVRPLRWDLWLAIISACILMGIVLRILEHRVAREDSDSLRTHKNRLGMIHLSPVAVLAFPERNMVSNNWSFLVLVCWLFTAFILMQSYTANLSAILTVDQLKFAFSDNYYIGYQEGSFMKRFLTQQLHISESRLRSYGSAEEYHKAMSLGSKKGGIDAVFDEIPYMKILINKYDSLYKMVGPTYVTGGFGFAFPLGSPLAAHFSKAILDVTQGPNMTAIEQKNFGPGYSSQDPLSPTISQETSSLSLYDFAGLFIIVGSVTLLALFCSETAIGRKLTRQTERFIHRCFFFKAPRVESMEDSSVDGNSAHGVVDGSERAPDNVNEQFYEEGLDTRVSEEIQETMSTGETLEARDLVTRVESNGERTM